MAKTVTPTPMPTTGMPDQVGGNPPTDMLMHETKLGPMSVNPGRPPSSNHDNLNAPKQPKT